MFYQPIEMGIDLEIDLQIAFHVGNVSDIKRLNKIWFAVVKGL